MARARKLLETPTRVWWEEMSLDGVGATLESAIASYEERMRELAEAELEPATPLGPPSSRTDTRHGGGGAHGHRYGHGLVRIRKRATPPRS